MNYTDVLHLIIAFVGGGLTTALLTHWLQSRKAREDLEREHLDNALRSVYAPVVRLLRECRVLLRLNKDVHTAYTEHFNQKWAESAQERVMEEAKATIETADVYCQRAVQNIDEIIRLANACSHLFDPEDKEVFDDIRRERIRTQVEYETPSGKEIPFLLAKNLGAPAFYKSEWVTAIESSYGTKMNRYRALSGINPTIEASPPDSVTPAMQSASTPRQ